MLGFTVFIAAFYLFIRWWVRNVTTNNTLFSDEVNGAIITAIVTTFTFAGMFLLNYSLNRRNSVLTIRDEIFRRRLEVYFQLLDYSSDMHRQVQDYISLPTPERRQKILNLEGEIHKYVKKHRFNLSKPMYKLIFELINHARDLVNNSRSFHQLTIDLELDQIPILTAKELENRFHLKYMLPFHQQFEREIGLQSIEKELHNLQ